MVTVGSRCKLLGFGLLAVAWTAFASTAQADLFVSSDSNGIVVQYDENTGDFLAVFAQGNGLGCIGHTP